MFVDFRVLKGRNTLHVAEEIRKKNEMQPDLKLQRGRLGRVKVAMVKSQLKQNGRFT